LGFPLVCRAISKALLRWQSYSPHGLCCPCAKGNGLPVVAKQLQLLPCFQRSREAAVVASLQLAAHALQASEATRRVASLGRPCFLLLGTGIALPAKQGHR